MTTNQQRISQLKAEISEKQAEIKQLESVKEVNWRAEKGGYYWIVNQFGVVCRMTENNLPIDDYIYSTLNYFQTKEQAEAYKEYLLALGKVTRRIWELNEEEEEEGFKYFIGYTGEYSTTWCHENYDGLFKIPYMASKEIAEKIISELTPELDVIRNYKA